LKTRHLDNYIKSIETQAGELDAWSAARRAGVGTLQDDKRQARPGNAQHASETLNTLNCMYHNPQACTLYIDRAHNNLDCVWYALWWVYKLKYI